MGDKLKKIVVFLLAILMVFAFSPFLFMNPNSGRQKAEPEETEERPQKNVSVTTTVATSSQN